MGIFSRFGDIVNANLNALLDKAENPEKMVRLIIQEMEDTLVEVRSSSARTLAEKKDYDRRLERLEQQMAEWESRAELALAKNREELARAALLEKNKLAEQREVVQGELARLDEQLERLAREISQLQEKLNDARARQKAILLRERTANNRLDVRRRLDSTKVDDALHRFAHYEAKIDRLESEADAYDLGQRNLSAEFADLEGDQRVEDELQALKERVRQPTASEQAEPQSAPSGSQDDRKK